MTFRSFPNDDDVRNEEGNVKGGRTCTNSQLVSLSRSVGKEIIMQIGKQILTGKFNLTKISFPIKIMIPRSALETAVHGSNNLLLIFLSLLISIIYNKGSLQSRSLRKI